MLYQKISEVIISKIKSSMRLSLWFMCYGLNFQLIWRKYQWGLKRGIILTWNPRKDNFEKKINIPWECEWPTTSVGADPLGFRIKGLIEFHTIHRLSTSMFLYGPYYMVYMETIFNPNKDWNITIRQQDQLLWELQCRFSLMKHIQKLI